MSGTSAFAVKIAGVVGAWKFPASNIVTQHVCSGSEASECAAACRAGDAASHNTAHKFSSTAKPIARGNPDRWKREAVMESGRIYATLKPACKHSRMTAVPCTQKKSRRPA